MRKTGIVISIIITALAGVGAVLFLLWKKGVFLPRWIVWENENFYTELQPDSQTQYEIQLQHKKVRVMQEGKLLWSSPENLKVQSAISADLDNDGEEELLLLCWKIGRYGTHRPFWVEKDERKWSQHIFVYEYHDGAITSKWMSSYLGQDVAKISAEASGNVGEAFRNRLWLTEPNGQSSMWVWDSWGFTKADTDVSFVVFGDNLIHGPIYRYGLKNGTFDFLFENVREQIAQSDVSVINQETPFTDDSARYSDYPVFGTPVQVGEAMAEAGFDIVTCATNHALDQGADGIRITKKFFQEHDMICLGIQSEDEKEEKAYEVITRKGIRFALFNYTYGTNGIRIPEDYPHMVHLLEDEDKIREDIARARAETDFVIVFAHWGTEYAKEADEFQQKWAQIFLECKADVVVGAHPHVLQPYTLLVDESGHEMLVYYSIGNFISAQEERSCVKGGMAGFTVSLSPGGCRITEYYLQPLEITQLEGGRYTTDFALCYNPFWLNLRAFTDFAARAKSRPSNLSLLHIIEMSGST